MRSLRPYQHVMADFITETRRGNVWAGMGLGKTVSTATALEAASLLGGDVYPVLVVAPLRVARSTWPQEYREWEHLKHLRVQPILGTLQERRRALRRRAEIYTINYENLAWLRDEIGQRKWHWPTVVADEASKLKGFRVKQGGQRAAALGETAHLARRWVNLTGTPASNGLKDLWGQQWFVDRGRRLGVSYQAFMERWFHKSFDGRSVVPHDFARDQIYDALRDCTISLEAKDHFDLPELVENVTYIDLPTRVRDKYRKLEKELYVQLSTGDVEAFSAGAKSQKCLQFASGAVYLSDEDGKSTSVWEEVHDEKLDALDDIIEEAAGAPVLVAYNYRFDIDRIKARFPQARVLDKNPKTLDEWNAGSIPILLAHPASAGHGLNMQHGGNILVMYGPTWNLEERLQIMERIGPVRQAQSGYNRPVFVHHIVARDTIDEVVLARISEKQDVQQMLLEALKRNHRG